MRRKEIYWLLGTITLVLILNLAIFGIDGFKTDSTFSLNVHDTYYVVENIQFLFPLFVLMFFCVYSIRTLGRNFKNLTANLILMIVTILLILVITGLNSIVDSLVQQTSGWTTYPPLSSEEIVSEIEPGVKPYENNFGVFSNAMLIIHIVLLILLGYCGFKTGLNYKRKE
ncbi:hypothetical protein [Spongiimicrobium sp. 2-473A-2-J]|uniref:hypothetical protein n=1 Tax=Eudoraea algarum TaxID=3417568 RepID=UPI003D3693F3